jgi:dTMP kinase
MKRDNLFIAFEGIDGSGKSTQIKILSERLKKEGHKVYVTFEPTDGPIGSIIKNIFNRRLTADEKTIAGLFVADRLDHLLNATNGILKKMEEGYTVITDRYYFSSYAYHGVHVPVDWVIQANSLSAQLLRPDINIYIDIPPEASMERLNKGRHSMDFYETLDNLTKVRNLYLDVIERLKNEENTVIVEGNRTTEAIASDIWNHVITIK